VQFVHPALLNPTEQHSALWAHSLAKKQKVAAGLRLRDWVPSSAAMCQSSLPSRVTIGFPPGYHEVELVIVHRSGHMKVDHTADAVAWWLRFRRVDTEIAPRLRRQSYQLPIDHM
jgi:hypothetical protein